MPGQGLPRPRASGRTQRGTGQSPLQAGSSTLPGWRRSMTLRARMPAEPGQGDHRTRLSVPNAQVASEARRRTAPGKCARPASPARRRACRLELHSLPSPPLIQLLTLSARGGRSVLLIGGNRSSIVQVSSGEMAVRGGPVVSKAPASANGCIPPCWLVSACDEPVAGMPGTGLPGSSLPASRRRTIHPRPLASRNATGPPPPQCPRYAPDRWPPRTRQPLGRPSRRLSMMS